MAVGDNFIGHDTAEDRLQAQGLQPLVFERAIQARSLCRIR